MATVVCNYNCRQANLYDLPASKPTLADWMLLETVRGCTTVRARGIYSREVTSEPT